MMPSMPMPPADPMMGGHESASKMTEEMQQPRDMTVESVTIRPAANGGFIATCSKRPAKGGPSMGESKDYAFTSLADVQAFVGQELGAPTAATPVPAPVKAEMPMMDEDEADYDEEAV